MKPKRSRLHPSRPSPLTRRPSIEVAAALIFRNGKLLIAQRHPHAHLGGLWEFPGGKREAHESFEQCLVRELREELGIDVTVGELLGSTLHHYPEKWVHLRFFLCEWIKHQPQALDCAAFKWITADELNYYEFPAADALILKKLRSNKALWK